MSPRDGIQAYGGNAIPHPTRRVRPVPAYGVPSGKRNGVLLLARLAAILGATFAVAILASIALAFFGGSGEGSATFNVGVANADTCIPLQNTTASATTLAPGSDATAASIYNSASCVIDFNFGLPRGAMGPAGTQGVPGADSTVAGPQGAPGVAGDPGSQGVPGANGQSVTSAAVADCNGTGRPGSLFNSASGGTFACDGATGAQGLQGLTGDPGPQGLQGIQGIQGLTGTNGVSGLEVVVSAASSCGAAALNKLCTVTVACPGTKKATGGGGAAVLQTSIAIRSSFPSDAAGNVVASGTAPAWTVVYIGVGAAAGAMNGLTTNATCITAV